MTHAVAGRREVGTVAHSAQSFSCLSLKRRWRGRVRHPRVSAPPREQTSYGATTTQGTPLALQADWAAARLAKPVACRRVTAPLAT